MPVTHISRQVSFDEAEAALTRELGPGYKVTRRSYGSPALTVKRNGLLWATVTASPSNGGTTFNVHGGGVIINRLIAEFGLARKVNDTLNRSLSASPPPGSKGL